VSKTDAASAGVALMQKSGCVACHGLENKIVGPSFRDVARKYAGRPDVTDYLAGRIRAGGSGVWGAIPMPPQALADGDAKAIAQWLADGARQ
jgi:cytochrome c